MTATDTYELSDGHERWRVVATDANAAVATAYASCAGTALEVDRVDHPGTDDEENTLVLYALVDDDGDDHRSWSPDSWGPVEAHWIPVWQDQ